MTHLTTTRHRLRRGLAASAAAAVAGVALSGCTGGGSGGGSGVAGIGGAPDDASTADFCEAYNSLQADLLEGFDASASPEEQAQRAVEVLQGWTTQLEETGTPAEIPDEAREGYELIIEASQDLPEDASASDFEALEDQFSDAQNQAADAFGEYATDECPTQLPSELPSDLPTDQLPSEVPTELPSDFPTELLSELPSDFDPQDLPSDFPTELLSDLPSNLNTDGVPTELPDEIPSELPNN